MNMKNELTYAWILCYTQEVGDEVTLQEAWVVMAAKGILPQQESASQVTGW